MSDLIEFVFSIIAIGVLVFCWLSLDCWRHKPAIPEPNRVAGDYSPDERLQFQQKFQPLADRYRRRRTRLEAFFGILLISVVTLFILVGIQPHEYQLWIPWIVIGGMMVGLVVAVAFAPKFPTCPACHGQLDGWLGHYCPSCGRRHLQGDSYQAHCTGCRQSVDTSWREGGRGRHRRYLIRACTRCGLLVDQKGL